MRRQIWVIPVVVALLVGAAFSPSTARPESYNITLKTYFDGLVRSEIQQRSLHQHFGHDVLVEPMTLRINVRASKTETRFVSDENMVINHELLPAYLEVRGVLSTGEDSFAIEFDDGFHETIMSSGRTLIYGSATGWVGTKDGARESSFFLAFVPETGSALITMSIGSLGDPDLALLAFGVPFPEYEEYVDIIMKGGDLNG